jgi:peroxiredoxin
LTIRQNNQSGPLLFWIVLFLFAGVSGCSNSKLKNGMEAPDFSLPGADGQQIRLSGLEGNIVLLDFWASWCTPCRKVNPELVELYKKYHDANFKEANNFTIFSVSLDKNKQKWLKAKEEDNLLWPHHAIDPRAEELPVAKKYGVASIPASFLIDEEGIIIGVDLEPDEIKDILDKRIVSK